jgi:Na+/H+ antiporter NhaC
MCLQTCREGILVNTSRLWGFAAILVLVMVLIYSVTMHVFGLETSDTVTLVFAMLVASVWGWFSGDTVAFVYEYVRRAIRKRI